MIKIKLGDKVKDRVTGLTGIATSRTEFLNGCIQIEVTPKLKKNENLIEKAYGLGIDEEQLERVGCGINTPEKKIKKSTNGGPMRFTMRKAY